MASARRWSEDRASRSPGARRSALDHVAALREHVADTIAQVALELDAVLDGRAAGTARALQVLRELFQERLVLRQAIDDGHSLAAAAGLLNAQLRNETVRDGLAHRAACAALTIAQRPAADGTLDVGRR